MRTREKGRSHTDGCPLQGLYTCASGMAVSLRDGTASNVSSTTAVCVSSWDWSSAWQPCPSCTPVRGELPLAGSEYVLARAPGAHSPDQPSSCVRSGSLMCFPTNSSSGPPLEIEDGTNPLTNRRRLARRPNNPAPRRGQDLPPCVQVCARVMGVQFRDGF